MSFNKAIRGLIVAAVLMFVGLIGSLPAFAQTTVTTPKGLAKKGGSHPAVLRTQELQVDFASLKGDFTKLKGAKKSIRMKAFSDLTIDAEIELKNVVSSSRGTYVGKTRKNKAEVILSRNQDAIVMDIELDGGSRHVQIRPKLGGGYIAEEYDVFKFPSLINDSVDQDVASLNATTTTTISLDADAASLVDVLVMFTSDSASNLGGLDAATAFADNCAASFNLTAANSQIGTQLRVVGVLVSATAGSGVVDTDYLRLKTAGDGYLDEAVNGRDFFGADVVSLITDSSGSCGVGQKPGYYTIVVRGCALGNRSFAHEIGHNFGCSHDIANSASTATTAYSYGWRFVGLDGATYRTVMSYAPGARISYFSNPNIMYQGVATGDAIVANNTRQVVEYSNTIANLRQAVTPQTGSYITFSVSTLIFGSVNVGESKSMTLTLKNNGGEPIALTSIVLQGTGFASTNSASCLVALSAFGSCAINITFSATSAGNFNGSVIVSATGAMNSPASALLSASAVAPSPNIVAPASLSFARTAVGSVTQSSLRISNNGTSSLSIASAALVDVGGSVFAVVSNACVGSNLIPGAFCDMTLRFAPLAAGSYTGRVTITSNDQDQSTLNINLTGSTGKAGGGGNGGRK